MTDSEDRPRPSPRPRPGAAARPSPRPRVAGSRRDREEPDTAAERTARAVPAPRPRPGRTASTAPAKGPATAAVEAAARPASRTGAKPAARRSARPTAVVDRPAPRRRGRGLALTLAVLCLLAAAAAGFLFWQRSEPAYVDPGVFAATRENVEALYAYDYRDSDGSVEAKLAVLTGDLRDQYEQDLSQGGIIDTYEQVSATTSYEVLDVGLQQIDDAQDSATLVVFGRYVVESVNSGEQAAPEGSECEVTADGAQACTQTVRVHVVRADGDWKIDELTLLTTA
ncbi:hypothetical protein ACI797_20250 [Geodermatophilus sp. SYSU D00691]